MTKMSRSTTPGRPQRRPSSAKAIDRLSWEKSGAQGSTPCQTISPRPLKNVRRRNDGCRLRSAIIRLTNRKKSAFSRQVPVQPTDLVVLTPSIVVAELRPQEFVASQKHRHALRNQQSRDQVASLATAQRENVRVVGGAFRAVIPTKVLIHAVSIALAVGFIVLPVV